MENRIPQREFHNVIIPDYVRLKYSFIIWTDYVAQNNKIVEAINYSSDSYWGDPERFKFNARIDSFVNNVEVAQGVNRVVKTNFEMTLQGYIIPDAMGAVLKQYSKKRYTKSAHNTTVFVEKTKGEDIQNDRKRQPINKVGDGGVGIGYDRIGEQQIG